MYAGCYYPDRRYGWWWGDLGLHWILSGAFPCSEVVSALSEQGLLPSGWSRDPRSVSDLRCEAGGIGAQPLGEKSLSFPPQEWFTRACALLCHFSPALRAHTLICYWACSQRRLNRRNGGNQLLSGIVFTRLPAYTHWSQVPGLPWLCRTALGALEAAQTVTWPNLYTCVPTKPTVAKTRLLSVVGALAHSGVRQGLSLQSRPGWWGGGWV